MYSHYLFVNGHETEYHGTHTCIYTLSVNIKILKYFFYQV